MVMAITPFGLLLPPGLPTLCAVAFGSDDEAGHFAGPLQLQVPRSEHSTLRGGGLPAQPLPAAHSSLGRPWALPWERALLASTQVLCEHDQGIYLCLVSPVTGNQLHAFECVRNCTLCICFIMKLLCWLHTENHLNEIRSLVCGVWGWGVGSKWDRGWFRALMEPLQRA